MALPDKTGFLRVIAGQLANKKGPASTHSPILVADGEIKTSGHYHLALQDGWTTIVVVRDGQLKLNGKILSNNQTLAISGSDHGLSIEALSDSKLLILSGKPIDEPIIGYGPFVMNSEAEIKQAITDYQTGKFGRLTRI
ncbi:pirin family protein [Pseudoalteromonas sp. SaAl2]